MASSPRIEWTHASWNPVTGCSKVSEGCTHCYAERMARRLQAMGNHKYARGFEVSLHPEVLNQPPRWRKPRLVFVNSMGDLFHEKVPTSYIRRVFDVISRAQRHQFQLLTKRSERLDRLAPGLPWPPNLWMGVTVENRRERRRMEPLVQTGAAVKWLSMEPLLQSVGSLDLSRIDWVVVGGESGPGARPMQESWVLEIQRQCRLQGVAFFFKQWGGVNKKKTGRLLRGRLYNDMPSVAAGQISLGLS